MPQDEAAARSLASFGAAAEDYDSEAQSFFPRFGQGALLGFPEPRSLRLGARGFFLGE